MRIHFCRRLLWLLVIVLAVGLCIDSVSAQQRRRRRQSRRVTNPVTTATPASTTTGQTTPSTSTDPTIISTDDTSSEQPATTTTRGRSRARASTSESEQESMRRTVDRLSTQVNTLSDKIGKMEEQQRTLLDMERLSRAEQRAESFRTQLREVQAKEADLQARLEQVEYDLRPENIERATQTFGSTRPEEVREARRRALESERTRIQSQLQLMGQSRARLELAIANADNEADNLRARLEQNGTPPPATNTINTGTTETTPTTTTQPVAPSQPPREESP
jgi:chromosome segregation ATPase